MAAYEVLLLNTAIPQIQAAQSGDTYVVPRDIAFSAALTLSAGTANGVPYLNASKVLTTGSALTFDGSVLTNTSGAIRASGSSVPASGAGLELLYGASGAGISTVLSYDRGAGAYKPLWVDGSYQAYFISGTEQMRLTSTGLGIGTTNPGQPLVVSKNYNGSTWTQVSNTTSGTGAAAGVLLTSDSSIQASLELDSTGYTTYGNMLRLRHSGAYPIGFFTSDTERARITSGGYFKASNNGTYISSTGAYHENVNSANNEVITYFRHTSATAPFGLYVNYSAAAPNGTGNSFAFFQDNAAVRVDIRSNGGIANYQANDVNLSDQRTKKDIVAAPSYWDKIKGIEIVHFKYKDQTHDDNNVGVIAQQVEQVAPEFVDQDGWGETPEDGVPLKSIYTSDMYHAAIKALQEAMARIEQLEAKVASLGA